jgi:ubiquinone/menaquinone biosynthesis C-methylase UbiE
MSLPFAHLSFPEIYEQELVGPLFRPFAEAVLDDLQIGGSERVLDIACGTGIVARLAKERMGGNGTVVGVDLALPMIAVARRLAPDVDWREGDATALPLRADEQFDVVICQQGFQFVPDKAAAAREMRRALAPGGRVAVSTWRSDEELPVLRELRRVAERHLGPIRDSRHAFGEPEGVEALLREAGFREIRSNTVARTIRFSNGPVFVRLNAMAMAGMSAAAKDMAPQDRERVVDEIVRDSAEVVRQNSDQSGFAYEIRTNVATARE